VVMRLCTSHDLNRAALQSILAAVQFWGNLRLNARLMVYEADVVWETLRLPPTCRK